MNKGQISLLALIGAGATILVPIFGYIFYQQSGTDSKVIEHESRISIVETRLERLPIIEEKINKLLEERKIKFEKE
jgi:hypothetical protein